MQNLKIPMNNYNVKNLQVGDMITISGYIYAGRDAVLPKLVNLYEEGKLKENHIDLEGMAVFHTAVSSAGIGPTSSNKFEIESSIPKLSQAGIKLHLGKGKLSDETVKELEKHNAIYAVVAPVTALLQSTVKSIKVVAFPEEGMEALHLLEVENFPAIVAIAHSKRI